MNYRRFGRSGLRTSEVGFGCWAIGGSAYGPTRDEESLDALEAAWENGVNFFDTADTYGHGHSEELLAKFLKGKPRDQIFIASKCGWDFYHGGSRKNFDPEYIRFACDESLKRLNVERIDLYQLHNPRVEGIRDGVPVGVLEDLKRKGKIRFLGVSIHTEEEALAALADERVDALQLVFNLLETQMAERVFPAARQKKVGVIVREPLACGLLTGKYRPDHQFRKDDHRRRWTREAFQTHLEKVERIKKQIGSAVPLVQSALEYVLGFDAVSTVIPGAKTRAQVLENVRASKTTDAPHPPLSPEGRGEN